VLEQFTLKDYLQPESGFVGFFDNDPYLCNELCLGSGPARRTIIWATEVPDRNNCFPISLAVVVCGSASISRMIRRAKSLVRLF
jgi:hypothetical protein